MMNEPDSDEKVKVYRPVLKKTTPIILPKEEINYSPKLTSLTTSGKIKMRVNAEAMLDTVSDGLYASPKSGVRELLFNEVRACKTARDEFGANPEIEIRINPNKEVRSFEIIGIDSMGFSIEEYNVSFCETGASTNFNEKDTGQFGLGRLSYVKMSPLIRYDVWARRTNELYAFTMQDAKEMYPVDKPEGLKSYGCRIKLTLKDEVEINELIPYIENISRFADVPITLVMLDNLKGGYNNTVIKKYAGRYKVGSWTKKEYFQKLMTEQDKKTEDHIVVPIHIDSKYFTYDAVAVYNKHGCFQNKVQIGGNEITLINVPIDSKVVLPEFSASVLNLKIERANDEVNIKPATNRESLTDETDSYITKTLGEELIKYFKAVDINSVEDYYNNPICNVLTDTTIIRHAKNDDLDEEYGYSSYHDEQHVLNQKNALSRNTRNFIKFMNTEGVTIKKGHKPTKTRLANVLRSKDTFYLPKLIARWEDRLKALHENVTVFTIHKETSVEKTEELLNGMKKYGIRDGKEYAKENKLKCAQNGGKDNGEFTVHQSATNYGKDEHYRKIVTKLDIDDLTSDCIMIDRGSISEFTKLPSILSSSYSIMKLVESSDGEKINAVRLTNFLEDTLDSMVTGVSSLKVEPILTIAGIIEEAKETKLHVKLYETDIVPRNIKGILSRIENDHINVVGDSDTMFELGCHCINEGIGISTASQEDITNLLDVATTYELDGKDKSFKIEAVMDEKFTPNVINSAMVVVDCYGRIQDAIFKDIIKTDNRYIRDDYKQIKLFTDVIETIESSLEIDNSLQHMDKLKTYNSFVEQTITQLKKENMTDNETDIVDTYEIIRSSLRQMLVNSIENLEGVDKINAVIKHKLKPLYDLPIDGEYEGGIYKLKFKNSDKDGKITITKDLIDKTIYNLNEYGSGLIGIKVVNSKDSMELHISVGEMYEE